MKSTLTTAIPRLSSSSAQNKSSGKTATSSESAHKGTTSNSTSAVKASVSAPPLKKMIKPITPPTIHVCDLHGCKESFSQIGLLELHKLTVHRLLPQLIPAARHNGSITRTVPQVVSASHPLADGSKKVDKASNKRVRSPSSVEEDSGRKFLKLENGTSSSPELTSPLHDTAPKPWRNFARKSTGRSCSLKRKRVHMNRMQLKLTKVSTKGRKIPLRVVSEVKWPKHRPLGHKTLHGYRNPEFFRNLIRSQLKLPTTNQKAAATSDYISLQPDAESTLVKQTNRTIPGSGPVFVDIEDNDMCARTLPFTGNCARTRRFTPEVFSKPKKLSEQDRVKSSSSSSISTIGGELQPPSSEDESFPLVVLLPMVSQQQSCKESNKKTSPNLATVDLRGASPQPRPVGESVGGAIVHDVECDGMVQSPSPVPEKIQQETRIGVDPLPGVVVPLRPISPVIKSPTVLSPGIENNEYTMRLLQTIAKLSGDASVPQPSSDTGEKSRKYVHSTIAVPTYLFT